MSELRWNPTLREWVVTATHRQTRPLLPSSFCPFCVGAEEVPKPYEILSLPNRFPSFHLKPPPPSIKGNALYKVRKAKGAAEVVLYSSSHNTTLAEQSEEHLIKLITLWQNRVLELGNKSFIKYVFIFENKGEVIGVTLHHPHGQIYGFSFIPPIIKKELSSAKKYYKKQNRCLHCEIIKIEKKDKVRIVTENKKFVAFIPFYARWPYEVHIYPKVHQTSILELKSRDSKLSFARILKEVLNKYDALFNFSFPYMMVLHQKPTDKRDYSFYHWHIEFYPPYRAANKIKYLAGCESGTGTFINDTLAEEKAEELRKANFLK